MGKALANVSKLNHLSRNVLDYGVSPSRTASFNRSTVQELIDAAYASGGGEIIVPQIIPVDASLVVKQRVWLIAPAGGFVNQFVTGSPEPMGGGFLLATGSNTNLLVFRCDLFNDGGVLRETGGSRRNSEARHGGGARNLVVWGNRSLDQDPTVKDLNTSGDGIRIEGARYVTLENVFPMYCAGDGVEMASHDYGTGAISSNNAYLQRPNAHSNGGHGLNLAGGDNVVVVPNCGSNASSGIQNIGSGTVTGGLLWNNKKHGFSALSMVTTGSMAVCGVHAYDNDETGFRIGTGRAPALMGCVARGNGRNAAAGATDRSNFLVSSGAEGWSLSGCYSYGKDQTGAVTAQYGFQVNNTTYSGSIDGCIDDSSVTPWNIADPTKIIAHGGSSSVTAHPGLLAQARVDMNGQFMDGLMGLRYKQWSGVTITAGAIAPGNNSLLTLNEAAPTNLTDITFSSTGIPEIVLRNIGANAITVVHNAAKLRLNSGANVVLNQHQTIRLAWVSGSIWQQV